MGGIKKRTSRNNRLRSLFLSKACLAGCLLGCTTYGVAQAVFWLRDEDVSTRSVLLTDFAFGRSLSSEYTSLEEQEGRSGRFPSVEDRVKIYMGRWYVPPCDVSDKVQYRFIDSTTTTTTTSVPRKSERLLLLRELPKVNETEQRVFVAPKHIQPAQAIYLDRQQFVGCFNGYCLDTKEYIIPTLERLDAQSLSAPNDTTPIVLQ